MLDVNLGWTLPSKIMTPSSRTPEGQPNRCPFCNKEIRIEPSTPPGDAPCPYCGCLVWFDSAGSANIDPNQIEATKRKIREKVGQIAALGIQTELGVEGYFAVFLPLVVSCLAAHGGAVWIGTGSNLKLAYSVNLKPLIEENRFRECHDRLLYNSFLQGQARCVPPGENFGEEAGGNPTEYLLLFSPIKGATGNLALVEIFQRPGAGKSTQRGFLRFLQQMCELAGNSFAIRTMEVAQVAGAKKKKPWWKIWK